MSLEGKMKREMTMTLVLALALIAVSLGFRQVLLKPAEGVLNISYIAVLVTVGAALLFLFGIFIKRIFVRRV